jgi:hypothetical protein
MKIIQTILTLIGAYILYLLIRFFIDLIRQKRKVQKEGGMRVKYAKLVEWIMQEYPSSRIIQEESTFLNVGALGMAGTTVFWLTQTWGKVTIQYKSTNTLMGTIKLEWEFHEDIPQEQMISKMNSDIINKSFGRK